MHINANNIFITHYSDLQDRYDAEFYNPYYIINSTRQFIPLKKLTTSIIHPPEYPREFSEEGYQLIRSQNVRPLGISIDENPVFFSENFLENRRTIKPEIGDILVVRSGVNAGDTAAIEQNYQNVIIGADTLLCKCNTDVHPKFIQTYLFTNIGKRQITRHITGATNKHLNSSNLGKVLVPLLDANEQRGCIDIYENAIKTKTSKEDRAKKLLATIDEYLLSELGIVIPERDNSLRSRIFTTQFSNISGDRFDPYYNSYFFNQVLDNISKKECIRLKDILTFIESGNRPIGGVSNIENGILSFGGEHVNYECGVEIKNPKYISKDFHNTIKTTETKIGDILLVKDGATTGKVGIIEDQEFVSQNINEHVFLIRVNKSINPYYLLYILHSSIGQIQIQKGITGATVTGLTKNVVNGLIIPDIPIKKQNQIANEIKNIYSTVKILRKEANEILEQAKQRVEEIILGKAL